MGIIRPGLHNTVTLFLKEISKIDSFIETGTYLGRTTEWASEHFNLVYTIELSEKIFKETSSRLSEKTNITFLQGDSRHHLQNIIDSVEAPAIFWLDAHWSGEETAGEEDQCPLLQELEIIYASPFDHIVMIDDARTYTLPPRKPNNPEQFPTICDILDIARKKNVIITILDDVIYIIPASYKTQVIDFFQKEAAKSEDYYRMLTSDSESYRQMKNNSFGKRIKRAIKKYIL